MSMSIIIEGKLWGLIACHHESPTFSTPADAPHASCSLRWCRCNFKPRSNSEAARGRAQSGEIERELVTALSQGEFQNSLISHSPGLLDLIKADGCAVLVDGKVASLGLVPSDERIRSLVRWLDKQSADGVYATDSLPTQFEPPRSTSISSPDHCALSVSRTPKDYVLWFRPELVQVAPAGLEIPISQLRREATPKL